MNETKPLSPSEPRRQPSPTPPPISLESAELSPPELSSDDVLRELIADEQQAEAWIALEPKHLLRAADFREIEEGPTTVETISDPDPARQQCERIWPIPSLLVNGQMIRCPQWTLAELLVEIGAHVRQPPTDRKWQRGRTIPNHSS